MSKCLPFPWQSNVKNEWRLIIMTKSKKSIVMHGMLCGPLVLGHCAFLRANGSDYRTSPVVAIHQQSGDLVHFETLNSNYFLSMAPFPAGGRQPLPTVPGRVRVEKSKQ